MGVSKQYASVEDCIYTAGLADGEGCISITKMKPTGRMKSPFHHLFFSLKSTDVPITYWLQERFGGSVHIDTTRAKENHQTTYCWKLGTKDTMKLLHRLLPYLRIKQPQAQLAVEFVAKRDTERKGHARSLTVEELELRESFYQRMKKLNHRGNLAPAEVIWQDK